MDGKADLAYELSIDLMPEFEPVDGATLSLTKPVYTPTDKEVDEAVGDLAKQNRTYEAKTGKTVKAKDGDQVVIDFIGRVDGEAFEGGTANDVELVLGSGQFIPGFEEQLVGAKPDSDLTVKVTFPEYYQAAPGRQGRRVRRHRQDRSRRRTRSTIDDEFAKSSRHRSRSTSCGTTIKARRSSGEHAAHDAASSVKRQLLDQLDQPCTSSRCRTTWSRTSSRPIWRAPVEDDIERHEPNLRGRRAPPRRRRSEEYRAIAERRVRLGLVARRRSASPDQGQGH